jgi:selenium-dependent xanthine dehydrogenase
LLTLTLPGWKHWIMFTINLNGTIYRAEEDMNLLDFLRDELWVTSLKNGCGEGGCGACTVLADGKPIRACLLTVAKVSSKKILTVEGLSKSEKEAYAWAFAEAGAVQCGFCIPGMIISAKALLDKKPNPAAGEIKEAIRGNICRCTGYVKIEQAIGLAAGVLRGERQLKASAHTGIGTSLPRGDAREKVLGTGQYVDDMHMKAMLHGAVLRAKYPRALVKSIDVSAACVHPGVEVVLTAEDVPGERYWGFISKDWPVLVAVGEETRYVGDALALVAARSRRIAREALALIRVDYDKLEPVTTTAFALSDGAPKIHSQGNVLATTRINRGNAAEALVKSAYVVAHRYITPHTEHAFMEPESALAVPRGNNGFTIYAGSQSVYEDRYGIMSILGLPTEKVRVVGKLVGGAFGGKEDLSVQHHAALLAMKTRKPVKLTLTRQESILVHPKRHAMEIEMTTACDEGGRLTAVIARITADTGAYASLGAPVLQRACTHVAGPYHVPNADITGWAVYTNNPPAGAFRGFGVPQVCFACETNMDLLAEKVGISPWEIRYRNALEPGITMATGQIAGPDTAFKETLLAVKEIYQTNNVAGIACAIKNTGLGVGVPDTGRVKVEVRDGKVWVLTSAACVGQGLATILTQLVSETTGLRADEIEVTAPDTFLTPDAGTTTASRQTLFTGEAARRAALQLAEDMRQSSLPQLQGKGYLGEYTGQTDPLDSTKPDPVIHVAFSYATQVVVLDDQGRVKKVIAAHDVGRAINPKAVEGQIEGGIAMGLGYALREKFPLEKGIPTARFGTLGLFRSTDMPEVEVILIEKNSSSLAYGAKGVGEIATVPTAPAVGSAYHRYDGKLRFSLPLADTPYQTK